MNQRGAVGDPPDPPAGDPPAPPADDKPDLSTLFTADEIKTKQESVVTAKAEEDRRAKLKPDEIAAEDKAKADAEVADKVPEEYAEFKIPDGMKLDQNMLKEALPLFKEMGLSQTKAQQLVDLYSAKIGPAFVKAHLDAWNVQKESWKADCKADKEIGGDKFDGSVADAVRVLNTIGTPELKKVFDEYGLGNHPEFVRVFARMSKHMKEDTLEVPGDKGGPKPPADFESLAKSIYSQ
jgi:hypothetical protein